MEILNSKGCVYFFRHVGLTPVKIGFSQNESPINRFNQFKTYAPYGSEILGFIVTSQPVELEKFLHKKFISKRIRFEWYDLTEEEVKKEIDFYTSAEQISDRNDFQIAWAKEIHNRQLKLNNVIDELKPLSLGKNKKKAFFELYSVNKNLNKHQTALNLKVTRGTLYRWIEEFNKNEKQ